MSSNNSKTQRWVYLPLLFCSTAAIAAGQSTADPHLEEEYREVDNANYQYVGGQTRIGVGIDTEFDGTADISHVFSESKDTATSGDAWVGFDVSGSDKGINAGGVRMNHHWVHRDAQGRPIRVNKVFGAYDRNTHDDDKVTVGYGQEVDVGFWEAYVGRGLSDKRKIGTAANGRDLFEKGYKHNVGGQIGKYIPGSDIRIRGGLDYAWDNERGIGESKPELVTVSGGVEKFFRNTPHSVSLDVAASRNDGGHGKRDTDTRANLSYRYDFGGADIYQSDKQLKRVRVEVPGHAHPAKTVRKEVKVPYKQAYKKPVKVKACQLVKSTVELGSDTFFKPNSSRLLPSAKKRLNKVIARIHRTGYQGNIRITGNTCDVGTLQHNQKLSERRAYAVKRYFAARGFDRSELLARGLGETKPKYPNTPASRHKNRRVDIEYVTQDASCKDGFKTVYKTAYKTAYKTEYKDVVIEAGTSKPSVTWKTEVVQAEPAWVKRALHNSIRHNRYINTYQTTAGSTIVDGQPIITNDSATTTEGTPVTIDVLANDSGNGLTLTNVGQPSNGTASIVNGAIVYSPAQGFIGTDSFTYTATDSNGIQAQGTVTVTVTADQGVTPQAVNDSATSDGSAVTIDVLANDTGTGLTLTSITQPANGSASISNGAIVYTPNAGFSGTDTFTYTATDSNGQTIQGTVTVVVSGQAPNDPPVAQNDYGTSNGSAITIDVLSNDSDANNDAITIQSVTQPQNGTAVISGGQVVYTPNQNFTGTDTFDYTISDEFGNTATATITVTVTGSGANTAPMAQNDSAESDGSSVTINALANDSDPDGDVLTITSVGQPGNGQASIVKGQILYTPVQGFSGLDSFSYTISDGNGHTSTAVVSITVSGTPSNEPPSANQAPDVNDDYLGKVPANRSLTIRPLDNDSDPDGDILRIVSLGSTQLGQATDNGDGSISFMPKTDFCGNIQFTYTVTDGNGNTKTATIHMETI